MPITGASHQRQQLKDLGGGETARQAAIEGEKTAPCTEGLARIRITLLIV
jgi:hypothetical protein